MSRLSEVIAPHRLGPGFRWLLSSSWLSNLGDGIVIAAGPLLVASRTDDPVLVSLAALLRWGPQMAFVLLAGVLSDRLDRPRLVITADLLRAGILAVLVACVTTGSGSIAVILTALGLLSSVETFADNATSTLTPAVVPADGLPLAQARLQTGFTTMNMLAGPPLGALLFTAGHAWPFAAQALLTAAGAALIVPLARGSTGRPAGPEVRRQAWREAAEGFRWLLGHAAVRTLALTIFVFNITYGAAWSVLVLYAEQRLGLRDVGFGLITTVMAAGGLLGTVSYGWITRRVSLGEIMRIGLVIETLTHLVLALATSAAVALAVFFVFGAHATIWGTTSTAVRQRAVPQHLQGRVGSVYVLAVLAGLAIGAALGGALAGTLGVTAPFWFAFAGSVGFLLLLWSQLPRIAHQSDQPIYPVGNSGSAL